MTQSLTRKLTLAFSLIALLAAVLVALLQRLTSTGAFDQLVLEQSRSAFKSEVVAYYESHGSWEGIERYWRERYGLPPPPPTPSRSDPNPPPVVDPARQRQLLFGLADARGEVVLPLNPGWPLGATVAGNVLGQGEKIEFNGKLVGTILSPQAPPGLSVAEEAYLNRTLQALIVAALVATGIAFGAGWVLARTLTRPLAALTRAAHRIASGALEQTVPVQSADELGQLATAFNRMSQELARAHNARRQMTADVAHELRTPLTVVAGYIEALRDGELEASPERLEVIYTEIAHLQHLVGDLRTLTQAEAGELTLNRVLVVPREFLQQAQATFAQQAAQAGVGLQVQASPDLPFVEVDELRLAQVFTNLISNALRYTPAGGSITLGAVVQGGQMVLTVRDTGSGIAPADLPHIFDRFYRADKARTGEQGQSGLGLAIAKAIVDAHGGTLTAASTVGQGTTMAVRLPVVAGLP